MATEGTLVLILHALALIGPISSVISPRVVDENQWIKVRGVLCNYSSEYIYPNVSCFPKSYNRTFSTINVFVTFKKPISFVFIDLILYYKYGTVYREVLHTPRLDWCQLMKEGEQTNPMLKWLLAFWRDSFPQVIHECPYKDLYVKDQQCRTRTFPQLFPHGDYRLIWYLSNAKGEEYLVMNLVGSIISPLKETFG